MFRTNKTRRLQLEVNSGSMADIAFLLLIFFLVSTSIFKENGIDVILPPANAMLIPPESGQILNVMLNGSDKVLVEDEIVLLTQLKPIVVKFIFETKSKEKDKAIISLKNGEQATYKNYIEVYDQTKQAIKDFRISQAMDVYGKDITQLQKKEMEYLKSTFQVSISEIENNSK